MPQIQMLEPAPNFGSQLGQQLGAGLSQGLGQTLGQYFQMKKNRSVLEGLKPFYTEAGLPEEEFEQFANSGIDPQTAVAALKIGAAHRAKQQNDGSLSNQQYSGILDELDQILDEGGAGMVSYGKSLFSPKLRESNAKFQSLATSTLGLAQKVALKAGIRNQREFDAFLKRTVPNETDTVATAKGKIKALRSYLSEGEKPSLTSFKSESKGDFIRMRDPQGNEKLIPKGKALEAQKAGGKLIQ